nr:DUF3426 domain-containing protein [Ramlibacter aurantiacus]
MVAPALDRVGFVRQARNREFWQSGLVRALLTAVASVLVLLLVMQVLVHQRDRLAARQPQLRPLLEWLCVPIGCAVRPVRQVDAVAIEGSSFNRVGPTVYRLVFSVRNQADTPIAMPWFEITLSDPNEQPLVRRVLSPADLGLREPAVLGARADWSASLDLDLALDPATARVAGYRLLAFYP